MTNQEVYNLFEKMEKKFDNYCSKQDIINDQVIENKINIKNQNMMNKILSTVIGVCAGLGIIISRVFPS